MKTYEVVLSPEARDDLLAIYDWVAERASPAVTLGYLERLEAHLRGFAQSAERGHLRNDVRPGLRINGFERRVAIVFVVDGDRAVILRLAYGERNWEGMV